MIEYLTHADVYAPEPLGVVNLLLCAGKIAWIGAEKLDLPRSLTVRSRDLEGRRLVPGFIDAHVHVTGGGGESGAKSKVPPVLLSRFTRGGTTSVVGLLGTDDTTRSTAELLSRVRGLCEEGISAWCWTGGYHVPLTTLTGSVRGDIVHIDRCIGVGEVAISDHRSSQMTLDELLRIAADAHVAGLMTGKAGVVHLHVGDGARGLELVRRALDQSELPASVFQPTHVNRKRGLFEEALGVAKRGCVIDVTAYPVEKGEDAWSASDAVERYLDSGISRERVTVSSDGGGCLPVFDAEGRIACMDVGAPGALAETVAELVSRGRRLEEVLPVVTENVARVLRLAGKGRVAVGADADLVVLDERCGVSDVMAQGRWHVVDGEVRVRGMFEEADGTGGK